MLPKSEAEPPKIIQAFDELLERRFNYEKTLQNGARESFPRYRALYATLEKVNALEDKPISEDEINALASHLLNHQDYSNSLKQWVRDRKFNRTHGMMPPKARLLYDIAKGMIEQQTTP